MKKLTEKYIAMQSRMQSMLKDEKGATMVEYALMVALIAVVCAVTVTSLGGTTNTTFAAVVDALTP